MVTVRYVVTQEKKMATKAEMDRLIDMIKGFGQHKDDCQWRQGYDCSCGFELIQDEFGLDKGRL